MSTPREADAFYGVPIDVAVNHHAPPGSVVVWKQVVPRPKYFLRSGQRLSQNQILAAIAQFEEAASRPPEGTND